jgi:exodeoxyribonuclease-1
VQFAGFRTDQALNPVGDELNTYVRLPDDVLPNPEATLVTGIMPTLTRERGVSEWLALTQVHELFSVAGTCVSGFNSLRFDDEFIRFGFYRNLRDPYAREWRHGNSRWDLIDLVRATGALRRDGINWPATEEGHPIYKLEAMSAANGLEHGQAHDAMSDVRATVALARLIRQAQPKLFDYYLECRFKKNVRKLLEPYGARLCVHVSGMYSRERYCLAPVISVCRHPTNTNAVIVADLGADIEPLLRWSEDEIRTALFTAGADPRPPLKEVRINRCPFVAGIEVLTAENRQRLGVDLKQVEENARRLRKPGIAQKLMRVYQGRGFEPAVDVDAALYDGFLADADRSRCESFQDALAAGEFPAMDFQDKRLIELAFRLKSRSFSEHCTPAERADWHAFVRQKLHAAGVPWLTLPDYFRRLDELAETHPSPLLAELKAYGESLERDYPEPRD